ncbi:MAG: iron chaperone [Dehalococcoidia bacterium]
MPDRSDPAAIDAFLAGLPPAQRDALQRLREAVQALVPDATEALSYGVPTFFRDGPLLAYGAAKSHCSLYVMRPHLVAALKGEIAPHRASGGTIQFDPDTPIAAPLLERIVRARLEENEAAATQRRTRRPRTRD